MGNTYNFSCISQDELIDKIDEIADEYSRDHGGSDLLRELGVFTEAMEHWNNEALEEIMEGKIESLRKMIVNSIKSVGDAGDTVESIRKLRQCYASFDDMIEEEAGFMQVGGDPESLVLKIDICPPKILENITVTIKRGDFE